MSPTEPSTIEPSLGSVLSEIAQTASETLELQEVFERVATSVRKLIPLDNMGIVRIVEGDQAVLHASTFPCNEASLKCSGPISLDSWSPRMRPRSGPNRRIDDAQLECDPSYPMDGEAINNGARSAMWEPFRSSNSLQGGVWICSYTPNAFTDQHQEFFRPIAALLGSAVEHWRIWDSEKRRRERLDRLEVVLRTLGESLDVREVFQQVSDSVQLVLPHHLLILGELDQQNPSVRVVAYAGEADIPAPTKPFPLTEQELARRALDFEIIRDTRAELPPTTDRNRLIIATGMRSWMRVPVRFSGETWGSVGFFHRAAAQYGVEDVEVASRLADRIALALSHQRLAEEARIALAERERAQRLEATVETLARELESRGRARVIGVSRSWKETLQQVGRVASSETTVLITGESGTGKEVISGMLHQGSPRAGKPFVAINCAALPEQLLESELFGHEKGAFTGAIATKIGRIEQAAGGTLFLDEIGEMSPLVQAKFLRVLEERKFQRVGGSKLIDANVRVIAATNRDLSVAISRQEFREDLFYRLNVFEIPIAPLRERPEDILPLAEVFLEDLGRTMGRPAGGISRDGRDWLMQYSWPGNVRELRNAIERAILLCDGGLITKAHLPTMPARNGNHKVASLNGASNHDSPTALASLDVEAMDRSFVEKALLESRGNKSKAARLLGLSRAQLYTRLEKYNLQQ